MPYHGSPHGLDVCRGWCWCCVSLLPGMFPQTGKYHVLKMSRCGGKCPLRFSEQTIHTFSPALIDIINPSIKLYL